MRTVRSGCVVFLFLFVVLEAATALAADAGEGGELRAWHSANDKFQVQARLVEAGKDSVVLKKENGETVKVPREKLSRADLDYLDQLAGAAEPQKTTWTRPQIPPEVLAEVRRDLEQLKHDDACEFRRVAALPKQDAPVVAMAFSADASRLVTCTSAGDCRIWKLPAGTEDCRIDKKFEGDEFDVAVSPDGRFVAVAGKFPGFFLYDVRTKEIAARHASATSGMTALRISDDGQWLFGVHRDRKEVVRYPLHGPKDAKMDNFSARQIGPCAACGEYFVYGALSQPGVILQRNPTVKDMTAPRSSAPKSTIIELGVVPRWIFASQHMFVALSDRSEWAFADLLPPYGNETPDVAFRTESRPSYLNDACAGEFTPDEKTVALASADGHVEFRDVGTGLPILLRIPATETRVTALARTCRTAACADKAGNVSCWQIAALPCNEHVRFVRLETDYGCAKKYDRLEALGVLLENDRGSYSWPSTKYSELACGFGHFHVGEPARQSFGEYVEEWLKARPASTVARLVKARQLLQEAWDARGSGFAGTVTEEGWKVFRQKLKEAEDLVVPMADSGDCPPDTYNILFCIAKGLGWTPQRVEKYVDALARRADWYLPAHVAIVEMRMPRWGGESGDSEAYARRVADRAGGDDGDAIYARFAMCMSEYYLPKELFEDEKFDYERIRNGLRRLVQQNPDSAYLLYQSIWMARMHLDLRSARQWFDQLQKLSTPAVEGNWRREQWDDLPAWLGVK